MRPDRAARTTVVAPFETVRERVLSPEIRLLGALLTKRLTTMGTGRTVLAGEIWYD